MGKASLKQSIRVLQLVEETGWSADEINRRIVGHWGILRDIAEALGAGRVTEEQLRRAIFQSLLAACRQDLVEPEFTEKHYPLEPVAPDEDKWEVVEHKFDGKMKGEDAFTELRAMGYRLCGPRRAMEFIAAHPDLQLDHPLMVTARWQDPKDGWCAPVFSRAREVGRYLYVERLDRDFGDDFRPGFSWLVLKKRAA